MDTPQGPERPGQAPRFGTEFIGWTAVLLLALFGVVSGWFRTVWQSAELFTGEAALRNTLLYVLVTLGLLALLAGVLFALIEATTPTEAAVDGKRKLDAKAGGVAAVGAVVEAFSPASRSTVLFSIGLVLILTAAAGSGVVSISVGGADQDGPAETQTATPDG